MTAKAAFYRLCRGLHKLPCLNMNMQLGTDACGCITVSLKRGRRHSELATRDAVRLLPYLCILAQIWIRESRTALSSFSP